MLPCIPAVTTETQRSGLSQHSLRGEELHAGEREATTFIYQKNRKRNKKKNKPKNPPKKTTQKPTTKQETNKTNNSGARSVQLRLCFT